MLVVSILATTVLWVEPNSTVALFDLSAVSGCAPMELTVTDLSVDATQMTFDFGNGQVIIRFYCNSPV